MDRATLETELRLSLEGVRENKFKIYRYERAEFTREQVQALAEAFCENESVNTLYLFDVPIMPDGGLDMGKMIRINNSLVELEVRKAKLGNTGVKHIASALEKNSCLQRLSLRINNMNFEGAEYLSRSLEYNSSLLYLDVSFNNIGDKGAESLSSMLQSNSTLTNLDLTKTGLRPGGADCLSRALCENNNIEILTLKMNSISDDGASCLADCLMRNTSLLKLDLGFNKIGDTGAHKLADALVLNSSLLELTLMANKIGEEGGALIADALTSNNVLSTLNLRRNKIGVSSSKFGLALSKNSAMEDLRYNEIPEDTKQLCERNKKRKEQRFISALNSTERAQWSRVRIFVCGDKGSGKTALVKSLHGAPFNEALHHHTALKVYESHTSKSQVHWRQMNKTNDSIYESFLPRHAAQVVVRSEGVVETEIRNTPIATLNSKTNPKGGDSAPAFVKEMREKREKSVRENKSELLVQARRALNTNAMELSLWDFGNESVFFAMHHLFFVDTGLVILTFDMAVFESKYLNGQTMLTRILRWTDTISASSPDATIVLVGTFSAEIKSQDTFKKMNDQLTALTESATIQIIKNTEDDMCFFPVDNKTGNGLKKLRLSIERACQKDELTNANIPLRWFELLDEMLRSSSANQDMNEASDFYLDFSSVKRIAFSVGINSSDELEEALSLFKARGLILRMRETDILHNVVIVQPQWLADCLTKLILLQYDEVDIEGANLQQEIEMIHHSAVASHDLLACIWKGEQVDFLIDLMKHTLLLSDWYDLDNDQKYYLIPSLVKENFDWGSIAKVSGLKCVVEFSGTMPNEGLFLRLVCLVVEHSNRSIKDSYSDHGPVVSVYRNFLTVRLNSSHDSTIHLYEDPQHLRFILLIENSGFACEALSVFRSLLHYVNSNLMGKKLNWDFLLEYTATVKVPELQVVYMPSGEPLDIIKYKDAQDMNLAPWFEPDVHKQSEIQQLDVGQFLDCL